MAKVINGVPFRQNFVPASKYGIKCPYKMVSKKVTLHETDNIATAWNEIAYMIRNNNQTSYHVAIDDKEAVQGLPYDRNGWHSGDGGNGYGNRNTIAVEITRNYDRVRKTTNLNEPLKTQHYKAERNAAKFVAQLCIDQGIVANNANIKTHNDWNGKWCPRKILSEKRLQSVKNEIIKEYNRLKSGGDASKPVAPQTSKPKPAPSKPKTDVISGAKLVKHENGRFTVTASGIKVRTAPSTQASETGMLKTGNQINYNAVYEGNGYRWLRYKGASGNTLYVPYRPSNNVNDQWGTFGGSAPVSKPKPVQAWTGQVLRQGDSGPEVTQLQEMLSAKHYYPDKGAKNNGVDGHYGPKTANAVGRYQSMFGLTVDKIAGREVYNSLK